MYHMLLQSEINGTNQSVTIVVARDQRPPIAHTLKGLTACLKMGSTIQLS